MIDLYTKPNCGFCVAAKQLLNHHFKPFNEIAIGESIMIEELKERFPQARSAPVAVINGVFVGGFQELKLVIEGMENNSSAQLLNE